MGDSNQPGIFHKKFMKKHQQTLISLEIPLEGQEAYAWVYLLEHSEFYDYHWKVEDLTKEQVKQLMKILEEYEPQHPNPSVLYTDLQRQLSR